MESLDTYTSGLIVLSGALLLLAAGSGKRQLISARAKRVTALRRRSP